MSDSDKTQILETISYDNLQHFIISVKSGECPYLLGLVSGDSNEKNQDDSEDQGLEEKEK